MEKKKSLHSSTVDQKEGKRGKEGHLETHFSSSGKRTISLVRIIILLT